MGTMKSEIIVKNSFDNLHFSTNRQNNNFINCDATWIHNCNTEGVILNYFKEKTRL